MAGKAVEDPSDLVFFVNGKKVVERNVEPEHTLLWYLRNKLRLNGTKAGCEQGACGSCTVMVSEKDSETKKIRHYSVMACLVPICTLHGKAVTTVEGIGSTRTKLHPVQERLAKVHGVQCGFCSPGMVMSMYTLLRNNPEPTMEDIQAALQGNLCRCTGYRAILAAGATFTKECCSKGADCCMNQVQKTHDERNMVFSPTFDPSTFAAYDETQDLIFPSELMMADYGSHTQVFKGANTTFFQPANLKETFDILERHPNARVVGGCTAIAYELRRGSLSTVISLANVKELKQVTIGKGDEVIIGAVLTLSDLQAELKKLSSRLEASKIKAIRCIEEALGRIGANQIRNIGTIGGNIGSGRPNHDLAAWLTAIGCQINILSKQSCRLVPLDMHFYVNGSTILKSGEILAEIGIPLSNRDQYYRAYKHSRRPDFDWSIVAAGIGVHFVAGTSNVKQLTLAFSNLGYPVFLAKRTSEKAVGRTWDEHLLADLQRELSAEINDIHSQTGEDPSPFKKALANGFLQKFFYSVESERNINDGTVTNEKMNTEKMDAAELVNGPVRSTHVFEEVPDGQSLEDAVGRPIVHESAFECTTGQARFVDDIPKYQDEVSVAPVLSTKAHAKILEVDPSAALDLPGVIGYLDHHDVPGDNTYGVPVPDEELFATKKVACEGVNIGAIVAEDMLTARKAAKMVKVKYEELKPVLTVEEAMAANPDRKPDLQLNTGDLEAGFKSADHILEGETRTGAQEHFYIETNGGIVVPKGEHQEFDFIGTTQCPKQAEDWASRILGIDKNRIDIQVKRIGGGFGGKVFRFMSIWGIAAVAAYKLRRPARCVLSRTEDMLSTGKRHPILFKYKVGFTEEGKITALEIHVHANGGYCTDASPMLADLILLSIEGSYKIPNLKAHSYIWYTNTQSSTPCRGFCAAQPVFGMESIIHDIAQTLGVTPEQVRQVNLFKAGDTNVTGITLDDCTLPQCWQTCMEQSSYKETREQIEIFNREHEWIKRGIAMTNVKYPVVHVKPRFLNQAAALVNIYLDGTVLVHHGGIEMGQGLHTKIIQVASRVLNVPIDVIHIRHMSTNITPNQTVTAGSHGTDFFAGAVKNACEKLVARLQPFKDKKTDGCWKDWVVAAYLDQVSLSASGFWKCTKIDFDWATGKGHFTDYFTYGTACSQVEVDCLTGEHKVLRTDIVMDVGQSINPAIDVGQIEGGFMMGYGLYTIEENIHNAEGRLLTRDAHTYKIPSVSCVPKEFNVTLLKGSRNASPTAVYSAKGIGEPPLLMAASAVMAIKEAILARRKDIGLTGIFRLDAPATTEKIRMACDH